MKPIRTCLICKQKFEKQNLFRLVLENKTIIVDIKQNKQARATYICKNNDCLIKLRKQRALNRAFKKQFADDVYDDVERQIKNGCEHE